MRNGHMGGYVKALLKAILGYFGVFCRSFEGRFIGILAPYASNWFHRASWIPVAPSRVIRGPGRAQGKVLRDLLGLI